MQTDIEQDNSTLAAPPSRENGDIVDNEPHVVSTPSSPANRTATISRLSIRGILNSMKTWLDSSSKYDEFDAAGDDRVDWFRIIPFIAMHLMGFAVIWVGVSPIAVGVAAALYFFRMFAVTGFYHRYFSHRTFKTSRGFQFVMALIGGTTVQRGPLWWSAHHRHHHRHSDGPLDVHSPHRHGFLWSHIGWITSKSSYATRMRFVPDLAAYPELRWLDRFETVVPVVFATSIFGLGKLLEMYAPSLGTNGFQMLVWGFFVSTIVLAHCTFSINSLTHLFGRKRYKSSDESRNSFILALVTLGEGWHNNHHYYPGAVRQGFYWWEIDITFYGLKLLSYLGLIWDLNAVPRRVRESNKLSQQPAT